MTSPDVEALIQLHNRSAFARNTLTDRIGNPWAVRDYQRDSLESYAARKVHCDGRDVGKTTEIELIARGPPWRVRIRRCSLPHNARTIFTR